MGRLIDADKLKAHYSWWKDGTREMTMGEAKDIFDDIVDLQPTAEKHGHWVEENTRTHSMQFKCSECGRIAYYPQNHHSTEPKRCGYAYCPNCGARMDGGEDDADE